MEIMGDALERAGSGLHDVVRTRVILTDIDRWQDAIDMRGKYFADIRPVGPILVTTRFVPPEWIAARQVDVETSNRPDA